MSVGEPAVAAGRAVVGDESTEDVEEVNLLTKRSSSPSRWSGKAQNNRKLLP